MLEGLDGIDWDRLTHAYGRAVTIPESIRALRSSNPADWVAAMSDLYDALCHQMCSIYPATVAAIPFLIELLDNREVRCRGGILAFLADVTFCARSERDGELARSKTEVTQKELNAQTREAIRAGFDTYLHLLSDLEKTVRVQAPYLLGTMALADVPEDQFLSSITSRMQAQFEEEPNELIAASLVFGLACLTRYDTRINQWLEERVSDPHSSVPVRMAAAMNLAESADSVSSSVMDVLEDGLKNPDETNRLFMSDQPEIENRHHPIGRAMLKFQGELTEGDDDGCCEDMKFPWRDRCEGGCGTSRIMELLSKLKFKINDDMAVVLTHYLDRANEYTSDYVVLPVLRLVFGHRKLSPETRPEELSPVEKTVLLHLFNNLPLWATNLGQRFFDMVGLGDCRADWARVLEIEAGFSNARIDEILLQQMKKQHCDGPDDVREICLCRIGSADFLPHLRPFRNLRSLDLAETPLTDGDLEQLFEQVQLRMLRLNNTLVTDAGVEHLTSLTSLEELYLPGTKVTDACLGSLLRLTKLKYICLSHTVVTEAAAEKFMELRPECSLIR